VSQRRVSLRVLILSLILAAVAVFFTFTQGRGENPIVVAVTFPAGLVLPFFARTPGMGLSPPLMAAVGWLLYLLVGAGVVMAERKGSLISFSVLFALMVAFNVFVIVVVSALHGLQ